MRPNNFQKPEAALQRANDLIKVGKKEDALETLNDTFKNRRGRQWSQIHEQIILKHIELSVELRKAHIVKDALFQYKTLTQQVAVKSLETAVTRLLELAEARTLEAQQQSIDKCEQVIDDLDQAESPESLLLSAVSGAMAQDRMDRTVLSPWLRFLWDSYRNCLELLKNNIQVEQVYHRITRDSFAFCVKHQRRTEFRKLCDLLRTHLFNIQKQQHNPYVVKLTNPETLQLMQETRLCQLDTAIQMEQWQEAYRSAEDVHGMMQLSKIADKRIVKPSSYVNYYEKLSLIFWKAGNSLFHAAALLQKFQIYKDLKKGWAAEEAAEQATRVILAVLSVEEGADLPTDLTRHLDIDDQHSANIRILSNLLRLPVAPTRANILREAVRLGIVELAAEPVRRLYFLLETHFEPLALAKQANEALKLLVKPEWAQYVDALRLVTATKTLKQIASVYDSMSWDRICSLLPFYDGTQLESFLVYQAKHRFVRARLDQRSASVHFGSTDSTLAGGAELEEATQDDVTRRQPDGVRGHLEQFFVGLRECVDSLNGEQRRKLLAEQANREAMVYENHKERDFEHIIARKRKIENYKESSERAKHEKEAAAAAEASRREEKRRQEELKRLEQENIENERRRRQAEKEEVERKIRAEQLRRHQNNPLFQKMVRELGEEEVAKMDIEQVLKEQRERMDNERREQQIFLQQQEKKFDHQVRALHLEEMLERRALAEKRKVEAPRLWEQHEQIRVERQTKEREDAQLMWNSLQAILGDLDSWMADTEERNKDDFANRISDYELLLSSVRSERLRTRAEARRRERREKWQQQVKEEERRVKEEAEKQKQQAEDDRRRQIREAQNAGDRPRMQRDGRPRDDKPSAADAAGNWRSMQNPTREPPPPRAPPSRPIGEYRPPREDRSEAETNNAWRDSPRAVPAPVRAPLNPITEHRPNVQPREEEKTVADTVRNWRATQRPDPPPQQQPPSAGVPSQQFDRRPDIRREPPHASAADTTDSWRGSSRPTAQPAAPIRGTADNNRIASHAPLNN